MVENLEIIKFLDKKFKFFQRTSEKLIYQNIDKELEQVNILELSISNNEKRIKKIDVYTIEDEEVVESLHIIRGVDGVTEVNYYPLQEELINIDRVSTLYNISIYKTYSEENNKVYPELYEIELVKKGHKKHKFLTKLPLSNVLFTTKDNKYHRITSKSINKLNHLTQFLIPSILKIEDSLFNGIVNEETNIDETEEENIDEIIENYPLSLHVYDRVYSLIGIKNNALIYRNTEDDIMELEINFNSNKDRIKELKFIEYKLVEVEGIKHKAKRKIVRIIPENNKLKASLCSRKKENIYLNNHAIENVTIKANTIISEDNRIEDMRVTINSSLGNFDLMKSNIRGVEFIEKNNDEYLMTSASYILFKSLALYGKNIINNLENKLIYSNFEEAKEEKILIKK